MGLGTFNFDLNMKLQKDRTDNWNYGELASQSLFGVEGLHTLFWAPTNCASDNTKSPKPNFGYDPRCLTHHNGGARGRYQRL